MRDIMKTVHIKLLDAKAKVPSRAHDDDTGYDLTFIDVHKIESDTIFFKTGVAVQPPRGYYFEIFPRSSISKLPLMLSNSIPLIDENYRGEIIVPVRILHANLGQAVERVQFPGGLVHIFGVKPNSMSSLAGLILKNKPTLCQMVLRKREDCEFIEVDELDETLRGDGGFGSTDERFSDEEPEATISKASTRKKMKKSATQTEE